MTKPISGHTGLYCLIGSPVAHSISPAMHNESFASHDLDERYLAFDIDPDHLEDAVKGLKAIGCKGWNVTMPYKTAMCALADELSDACALIGACNTIINDNGKLIAHTTDGTGFMMAAKEQGADLIGKTMTLLGGGGAASAILVQAAIDGVSKIHVFNRRDAFFDKLEAMASKIARQTGCDIQVHDFDNPENLRKAIAESSMLVNATSVGMEPNTDASLIEDVSMFHPDLFVFDVIYHPEETKLLKDARAAGCKTGNGLYMLLYQGAASFKHWTGKDMPVEHIKELYFS